MQKKLPDLFIRSTSVAILAPLVLLIVYFGGSIFSIAAVIASIIMLFEAISIYKSYLKPVLTNFLHCLVLCTYICAAMYFLDSIRQTHHGFEIVVWLALSVWVCDIFAYLTGNMLKGPKILPSISPSKTWSGFFGGAIAAIIFAVFYQNLINTPYNLVFWSLFIGAIAHIGDFIESHYKRRFKVKDSGSIIPGHGGVLDRMDSMLSASCFVMLMMSI